MTLKKIIEHDRKAFENLKRYQLPNYFKKIGLAIFILSFIALFVFSKGSDFKQYAKYAILIGLLIISISKEKVEDELITNLRMQSYSFAFIFAVFMAILNPIASYVVNFITEEQGIFDGVGDWMVLWLLLSVQVGYFELLKRIH